MTSRRATASPRSTSSVAAAGRSSATSTRGASTTSCPAWRPRSSTSASTRTASCTWTRSSCRGSRRPRAGGAIIRTGAPGAARADFERELQYLFKLNEVLQKRVADTLAPALVFQEADLSVRAVRDIFSAHFERAIVDDEKQHHRLVSFFSRTAPELVDRVELYEGEDPLFEAYGVEPVINGMLERRVDLPSGGYLVIDYAEALTVIDVNTGSFTGKGKPARLEDTITKSHPQS